MRALIRGMDEIPGDGTVLVVRHDNGKVYIKYVNTYGYSMKLVKLPEKHGRLIDADTFTERIKSIIEQQGYDDLTIGKFLTVGEVLNAVIDDLKGMALYGYENAPTVIGAEDEG